MATTEAESDLVFLAQTWRASLCVTADPHPLVKFTLESKKDNQKRNWAFQASVCHVAQQREAFKARG
jgi:hypothetical protein